MNTERIAAILTVIETVVLVVWLRLARALVGAAGVVLTGGIALEELVRFRLLKGRFPDLREAGFLAVGIGIEVAVWILALVVSVPPDYRFAARFGVLFVGLAVEHAVIDFATTGRFRIGSVLGFSAIEAAGGAIWLESPSIQTVIVLAVTSFIEHRDGLHLSRT